MIKNVSDLGWVDLDLVSSPTWWTATITTSCPSRMMEHLTSKSTQVLDLLGVTLYNL